MTRLLPDSTLAFKIGFNLEFSCLQNCLSQFVFQHLGRHFWMRLIGFELFHPSSLSFSWFLADGGGVFQIPKRFLCIFGHSPTRKRMSIHFDLSDLQILIQHLSLFSILPREFFEILFNVWIISRLPSSLPNSSLFSFLICLDGSDLKMPVSLLHLGLNFIVSDLCSSLRNFFSTRSPFRQGELSRRI